MRVALLFAFCASIFTFAGCQDSSPAIIPPPPGAKVLTDEEREEFNKKALESMIPKE